MDKPGNVVTSACIIGLTLLVKARRTGAERFASQSFSDMDVKVSTSALENAFFFRGHTSFYGKSLYFGFKTLAQHCQEATPLLESIRSETAQFDLDPQTAANGYRSFLVMYDACLSRCLDLCHEVKKKRKSASFLLSKSRYARDLDQWNRILETLQQFLNHLCTLIEWNRQDGRCSLFPSGKHPLQELLVKIKAINSDCFYGRHGGFPVHKSLARALRGMLGFLASFSEYHFGTGSHGQRLLTAIVLGSKYMFDADCRAKKIASLNSVSNVEFCKTFWELANCGFMKASIRVACPSLEVNQLIQIEAEPLQVQLPDGSSVHVPLPNAHGPPVPIQVRLLSAKRRSGMPRPPKSARQRPMSDSLIIHCHGGAFVALNSECYEIYLRHWAVYLDVPILSIDYSLAPEFPFPRSLQEILYVYAWVLNSPQIFGTTAKKIIFVGDSAGGNLALGVALLASYLNLPMPSGLFMAYSPLVTHSFPSPSRLLMQTDLLLSCDFATHCQKAYAGHLGLSEIFTTCEKELLDSIYFGLSSPSQPKASSGKWTQMTKQQNDYVKENQVWPDDVDLFTNPKSPLLSPCFAPDEALKKMPRISIMSPEMDFCLDECVEFAKRCRRVGCHVTLDVPHGLPHGFLNFALLNSEAAHGSMLCVERIRDLLERAELDY